MGLPTSRQVAERLFVLISVSEAAHEQPPNSVREWLKEHRLEGALSKRERAFVYSDNPSQQQMAAASWRLECCPVLMWALGRLPQLPSASKDSSWQELGIDLEFLDNPESVIASAKVRDEKSLRELQDEIESQHWGIRAGPAGRRLFPDPRREENANHEIVYERHYAINWLCGYAEDWDDISTDT